MLQDLLTEVGVSQAALARTVGTAPARINMICNGKRGISADMAYRLGKAFQTGPAFWMNLEKNWELNRCEESDYAKIAEIKRMAA